MFLNMRKNDGDTLLVRVGDIDTKPLVAGDSFELIGSTLKHARRLQGLKISGVSQPLRRAAELVTTAARSPPRSGAHRELRALRRAAAL